MKLKDISLIEASDAMAKSHGTARIQRGDINPTIKYVSDLIGVPRGDLHPLGSVGKLEDSGDIDLAVDLNKFHPEHIDRVMKSHGLEGYYDKDRQVATYAVPVRGEEGKGKVQVDLMYTSNPNWAKFSYFSPGAGSRYKGAVRTVLLGAIAQNLNEPGTDHMEFTPDGELIVRAGRTMHLPSGLKRVYQYKEKNIGMDGYSPNMKNVSPEDFAKMYPEVTVKGGNLIVDDPEKVVKILFGKGVTPDQVESAEQVLHLVKKHFTPDQQKKIYRIASEKLKHLSGKVRLPPEIEDALKK